MMWRRSTILDAIGRFGTSFNNVRPDIAISTEIIAFFPPPELSFNRRQSGSFSRLPSLKHRRGTACLTQGRNRTRFDSHSSSSRGQHTEQNRFPFAEPH